MCTLYSEIRDTFYFHMKLQIVSLKKFWVGVLWLILLDIFFVFLSTGNRCWRFDQRKQKFIFLFNIWRFPYISAEEGNKSGLKYHLFSKLPILHH